MLRSHPRLRASGRRRLLTGAAASTALAALVLTSIAGGAAAGTRSLAVAALGPSELVHDTHGEVLNIVPPGSKGSYNAVETLAAMADQRPDNTIDQLQMYDALGTQQPADLTATSLADYFKDAPIYLPDEQAVSTVTPKDGVVIKRDSFGVPHVEGATYDDVAFGAGYAGTVDRMFLQDTLRHYGSSTLVEFLGPGAGNIAMDRDQLRSAFYTPQERQAQVDALPTKFGAEGAKVKGALEAFVAGINAAQSALCPAGPLGADCPAEYAALQVLPEPWVPGDVISVASLVGGIFGRGGGRELANAYWLQRLQAQYPADQAKAIFDELRGRDDPAAVVTIDGTFPYELDRVGGAGVALPTLDAETVTGTGADAGGGLEVPDIPLPLLTAGAPTSAGGVAEGPLGPIDLRTPSAMSNALLVDAAHSENGHPTVVFGPQTGYFAPQLLTEVALLGPGVAARGVSFAGTQAIVELGHGVDYAWSATSSSGDNVDTVAERLCNTDASTPVDLTADGYLVDGNCTLIDARTYSELGKPSAAGMGAPQQVNFSVQRTRHGIVQTRTYVGEQAVALVEQRSTYGGELDSVIGFSRIQDPDYVTDAATFQQAFDGVDYTFHWFYADDRDIAYFESGRLPLRADGVDLDFPRWGDSAYDWQGFLGFAGHPNAINPPQGYLANWNNQSARGFSANDSQYAYQSIYRSLLLSERIKGLISVGGKVTPPELTGAMIDAATTDLRGEQLLPLLLAVIGGDPSVADEVAVLQQWVTDGAHRVDRARTGAYDDQAAIALFDEWWESAPAGEVARGQFAVARDVMSGLAGDLEERLPQKIDDHPRQGLGSSWNGVAWYGYVDKVLRQVLGQQVVGGYSEDYCGDLATCRATLVASLRAAGDRALAAEGVATVDALTYDKTQDNIVHSAVGVVDVPEIDWQNRPTFQQVVSFATNRRDVAAGPTAAPTTAAPTTGAPTTGAPTTGAPTTAKGGTTPTATADRGTTSTTTANGGTTPTGSLAATGAASLAGLVALLTVGLALGLRRRTATHG